MHLVAVGSSLLRWEWDYESSTTKDFDWGRRDYFFIFFDWKQHKDILIEKEVQEEG